MKFFYVLAKYFKYIFQRTTSYNPNDDSPLIIQKGEKSQLDQIPPYIWMYWEDENLPLLIEECVNKIRLINPKFRVNLLFNSTLSEYLPNLNFGSADLPIANKSDIIRLNLLYEYGGLWIDSSIMFMEDLSWLEKITTNYQYDLVAFYNNNATVNYEYPIIESWFLYAPAKNSFIKAWMEELNPLKDIGAKAYFAKIKNRNDFNEIKQNLFREEYLLVYLAMQISFRNIDSYNIHLLNAGKSAFMYHDICEWNSFEIASTLSMKKAPLNSPKLIKLTSFCRGEIDWFVQNRFVNSNSIIGKFFQK